MEISYSKRGQNFNKYAPNRLTSASSTPGTSSMFSMSSQNNQFSSTSPQSMYISDNYYSPDQSQSSNKKKYKYNNNSFNYSNSSNYSRKFQSRHKHLNYNTYNNYKNFSYNNYKNRYYSRANSDNPNGNHLDNNNSKMCKFSPMSGPNLSSMSMFKPSIDVDFSKLPNLVLTNIFSFLNLKDRLNASIVCKKWRAGLFNPILWHKFNLVVYLCNKYEDLQSTFFKMKKLSKFTENCVFKFDANDLLLLGHLVDCLDMLKAHNELNNLKSISLSPIFNLFDDETQSGYEYQDKQRYTNPEDIDKFSNRFLEFYRFILLFCYKKIHENFIDFNFLQRTVSKLSFLLI